MAFGDINRVNTNLQSLSSQYSLNKINNQLADNQLKLSTGLRINKAEDDAAGFSIASELTSRIKGMEQAERNIGDAKSMLSVAETGLNSIMDILVDMKSKATQASTDSIGSDERNYIGDQIEALAGEINSIVDQTQFQGTSLIGKETDSDSSGTTDTMSSTSLTFQVGEGSSDTMSVTLNSAAVRSLFGSGVDINSNGDITTSADNTDGDAKGTLSINDGTSAADYRSFMDKVDSAIDSVASSMNQIGIDQKSLSIKQENIAQAQSSNEAARSRIQDADFAKVQSKVVRLQIQQQTSTSALAQANSSPQAVLGFLGG